tara:strand:+ start:3186 stop:3467 length:282 start_codon:yes stop_codon:yes gene_type:complete
MKHINSHVAGVTGGSDRIANASDGTLVNPGSKGNVKVGGLDMGKNTPRAGANTNGSYIVEGVKGASMKKTNLGMGKFNPDSCANLSDGQAVRK